jgi:hypothetical protein
MRLTTAVVAVALAAAVGGGAASNPSRSAARGLCKAQERVIFSCPIARKLASVCQGKAGVHYRFGSPDRLEIDIASLSDWSNIHVGSAYGGADAQSHIRFTRGTTHYLVVSGEMGNLSDTPGKQYGAVAVVTGSNGEGALSTLDCRGKPAGEADLRNAIWFSIPEAIRDSREEQADGPFDAHF